jgi:Leucine-rich repeat (LRR) protein
MSEHLAYGGASLYSDRDVALHSRRPPLSPKQETLPELHGDGFSALVREMGYVKARQHLRRTAVAAHQNKIASSDTKAVTKKAPLRLKASIELSATLGQPSIENPIEKMVDTAARKVAQKEGETIEQAELGIAVETSMRRSLLTLELSISHMKIGSLPLNLGDTLFLQLSHIRRISALGNNMTSLLSHKSPQVSAYTLRYVQDMNLACNMLYRLCPQFGMMRNLQVLDLAQNNLSTLPESIGSLERLKVLNLARNGIKVLPVDIGNLRCLERLDLAGNRVTIIPSIITKLTSLQELILPLNGLSHLAMLPEHLTVESMWHKAVDDFTGFVVHINLLTRERVVDRDRYSDDGAAIASATVLHNFQRPGTIPYRRRRLWLSINQIFEWEPVYDDDTGSIFYRNNVSGITQWEMPPELDILGNCASLTSINVSNNMLKAFPLSICNLRNLRTLLAFNNRMHYLPQALGALTALESLTLESNELHAIPDSIGLCTNLIEINVNDNHIPKLPDSIGVLPRLRKLYAAGNNIKYLPYCLGFSKSIRDVQFHENPLVDPPYDEIRKPLPQLLWYLRQRFMIEARGAPPPMKYVYMGAGSEVMEMAPEFRERLKKHLDDVPKSGGVLSLQLLGLKEIPREALKLTTLRELRLDMNNQLGLPNIPSELKPIRLLSMRACAVSDVPSSIGVLTKLTYLNLEDNYIETLPASFTKLRALVDVNLINNRLFNLPDALESLTCLKNLLLGGNNIELLPRSIGSMSSLETLDLSRNRVYELTESICNNTNLKKLNIEGNNLICVPRRFKELNLVELRLGYNRLEWLPNDLFAANLGVTIRRFSCPENNLLELPLSITALADNCQIEADYNPLRSPPGHILSEPLVVTQGYMRIRAARLAEVTQCLEAEDFVFVPENVTPIACDSLEDGTGFLTPKDMEEFDEALDMYINGEMYKCVASGREIVAVLTKLRDYRESELYLNVLNTLLAVIQDCTKDARFGPAVLSSTRRPWGREGEGCNCWVLSLHALLRDTPRNRFQLDGRPSVLSMMMERVPHSAFPFTIDLLKDSLRLFMSPYGQVADTEMITFDSCDCIDEKRRKPLYHTPCQKTSVIILKIIFSEEEAERRAMEEKDLITRFDRIDTGIRLWLGTTEGRAQLKEEVRKRRAIWSQDVKLRTEVQSAELKKTANIEEEIEDAKARKIALLEGLPFEEHEFNSEEEANKTIADLEANLAKQKKRNERAQELRQKVVALRQLDDKAVERMAADDLVQKYCYRCNKVLMRDFRKYALKHNLRRPWDGDDGEDFEKIKRMLLKMIEDAGKEADGDKVR